MSKRVDTVLLGDIAESIDKIRSYTHGLTVADFLQDAKTQDAVVRNFEIIGEAVSRMNAGFREQYPEVSWQLLKDFRNILIHAYEIIDYSLVWSVIEKELSPLDEKIKTLLANLTTEED